MHKNRLNKYRIPYCFPRSVYSTHRVRGSGFKGYGPALRGRSYGLRLNPKILISSRTSKKSCEGKGGCET